MQSNITLEDLNTRDTLLLSQLIEELKIENLSLIHEKFINHPAFSLSHNDLHRNNLPLDESQMKDLVDELMEKHKDLSIIGICEHYYILRKEEIAQELSANKELFAKIRQSVPTDK